MPRRLFYWLSMAIASLDAAETQYDTYIENWDDSATNAKALRSAILYIMAHKPQSESMNNRTRHWNYNFLEKLLGEIATFLAAGDDDDRSSFTEARCLSY